jgi:hypothetical protein
MYSYVHFYTSASSRIVRYTYTPINIQRVSLWTLTRAEESNVRNATETVQSLSTTHVREDIQRVLRYNFLTQPSHDYKRWGDTWHETTQETARITTTVAEIRSVQIHSDLWGHHTARVRNNHEGILPSTQYNKVSLQNLATMGDLVFFLL